MAFLDDDKEGRMIGSDPRFDYLPLRYGQSKLDTRLIHCLRNGGYSNLSEALDADPKDLMEIPMFGRKCLGRIDSLRK